MKSEDPYLLTAAGRVTFMWGGMSLTPTWFPFNRSSFGRSWSILACLTAAWNPAAFSAPSLTWSTFVLRVTFRNDIFPRRGSWWIHERLGGAVDTPAISCSFDTRLLLHHHRRHRDTGAPKNLHIGKDRVFHCRRVRLFGWYEADLCDDATHSPGIRRGVAFGVLSRLAMSIRVSLVILAFLMRAIERTFVVCALDVNHIGDGANPFPSDDEDIAASLDFSRVAPAGGAAAALSWWWRCACPDVWRRWSGNIWPCGRRAISSPRCCRSPDAGASCIVATIIIRFGEGRRWWRAWCEAKFSPIKIGVPTLQGNSTPTASNLERGRGRRLVSAVLLAFLSQVSGIFGGAIVVEASRISVTDGIHWPLELRHPSSTQLGVGGGAIEAPLAMV